MLWAGIRASLDLVFTKLFRALRRRACRPLLRLHFSCLAERCCCHAPRVLHGYFKIWPCLPDWLPGLASAITYMAGNPSCRTPRWRFTRRSASSCSARGFFAQVLRLVSWLCLRTAVLLGPL